MQQAFPWRVLVFGVAAIVLLVAGFAVYGVIDLLRDPSGHSLAYANRISVTGYTDISLDHTGGGSCECVQRWYIGPVLADPTPDFTGPGLVWTPISRPQPSGGWTPVAAGTATSDRTGPCTVTLDIETPQYLRPGAGAVAMSTVQTSLWQQNQLQVVEIGVRCDRDTSG